MLGKFLARCALRNFSRRYNYDVEYMHHMLNVAPVAFLKFAPMSWLAAHRDVLPAEAAFAAKLMGSMKEDCGPCVQLTINMALEAGVTDAQIMAVVKHDLAVMNAATALGYTFATAILNHAPEAATQRDAVRAAWGDKGLVELTLALQISRVFPMLKAGLGHAESCQRLQVGPHLLGTARPAT